MLTIRPESPDQPEVVELLAQLDAYLAALYPPEANHILDVKALLAPDVYFQVARRAGRLVGIAAFRRMPGETATGGEPYGEIKRMYVPPAERGQRIAEKLLHALEDRLLIESYRWALLETGVDQHEAIRLYERCGYTRRAAFAGYPDNGLSAFYAKAL
ncbi:GNAT family N-acetyltransferase [Rubrivivax gelatinosus]|uniref:GNAT family N-acetyltransferase n=1 Tax=Rubrivivax gelatinosus TaxID=28068 RepID=A0ABS1DTH5_RUBGE|nr:GNAT family N-acetyltransferase [Rubrivivax gelatinosus]MBK1614211.1 GNAT family N-acetyltransferase [Rubrivivax gelatinosus]MBK1712773.1 GNAT family N-acetyltransferase [Rubrivivax gelatinosus]